MKVIERKRLVTDDKESYLIYYADGTVSMEKDGKLTPMVKFGGENKGTIVREIAA